MTTSVFIGNKSGPYNVKIYKGTPEQLSGPEKESFLVKTLVPGEFMEQWLYHNGGTFLIEEEMPNGASPS